MHRLQKNNILNLPSIYWIGIILFIAILVWFYGFYPAFMERSISAGSWLSGSWTKESDYEHGWMVPLLAAYMSWHGMQGLKEQAAKPSLHGLWAVLIGGLCLIAARTQQARVAIGALPFLIIGMIWCYWEERSRSNAHFHASFCG